jgi:hypothetical protein
VYVSVADCNSSFFDTASSLSSEPVTELEVPFRSDTIHLYLDLVYEKGNTTIQPRRYRQLIDFCEFLQSDTVINQIKGLLTYPSQKCSPWDKFCVASYLDDVKLARMAIKEMHKQDRAQDGPVLNMVLSMTYEMASNCDLSYLVGFNQAVGRSEVRSGHTWNGKQDKVKRWSEIAKDFVPLRPQ